MEVHNEIETKNRVMATSRQTISRRELYDAVWHTAMWKLAPQFGLSDRGLAKLCERHGIPVPERGYWAKLLHGKTVRRPPLPSAKAGQNDEIMIEATSTKARARRMDETGMPDDLAKLLAKERAATNPITVPDCPKAHPIVANWPRPNKPYNVVDWTPVTEHRRRKIATLLFREVEKRGGSVAAEGSEKFVFSLMGQKIELRLRERQKQIRIPGDPNATSFWDRQNTMHYKQSGLLRLAFTNWFNEPVRKEWNETTEIPLEAQLRDVIIGWLLAIEAGRRREEARIKNERERVERQIREWECQEREREELQKRDKLLAEARAWSDAALIRSYVVAVKNNGEGDDEWSRWALDVADAMEPRRSMSRTDEAS